MGKEQQQGQQTGGLKDRRTDWWPAGQELRVRSKKAHQSAGSSLEEGALGRVEGQSVEGETSKRYTELWTQRTRSDQQVATTDA